MNQFILFLSVISSGLLSGALHVITGPDHLAAIAPMAVQSKTRAWKIGVRWGLGHSTGVILVAILAWILRESLSIERFSSFNERIVGLMLVGIGLWGLKNCLSLKTKKTIPHQYILLKREQHQHAAVGVGVLHGLAGGSHFLGVLPALAMPSRMAAAAYLFFFGVGTIFSMAGFSTTICLLGKKLESQSMNALKKFSAILSLSTVAIGCWWLL